MKQISSPPFRKVFLIQIFNNIGQYGLKHHLLWRVITFRNMNIMSTLEKDHQWNTVPHHGHWLRSFLDIDSLWVTVHPPLWWGTLVSCIYTFSIPAPLGLCTFENTLLITLDVRTNVWIIIGILHETDSSQSVSSFPAEVTDEERRSFVSQQVSTLITKAFFFWDPLHYPD